MLASVRVVTLRWLAEEVIFCLFVQHDNRCRRVSLTLRLQRMHSRVEVVLEYVSFLLLLVSNDVGSLMTGGCDWRGC